MYTFACREGEKSINSNLAFFISKNDLIILRSGWCCKNYIKFKRERSLWAESASHIMLVCLMCTREASLIQWGHLGNLHPVDSAYQVASKEEASSFQGKLVICVILYTYNDRNLTCLLKCPSSYIWGRKKNILSYTV